MKIECVFVRMAGQDQNIIMQKIWEIMQPIDEHYRESSKRQRSSGAPPIPMPGTVANTGDVLAHMRQQLDALVAQQQQQYHGGTSPLMPPPSSSSPPPPPSSSSSPSTPSHSMADTIEYMERLYGKDGIPMGLRAQIAERYLEERGWTNIDKSILLPRSGSEKRIRDESSGKFVTKQITSPTESEQSAPPPSSSSTTAAPSTSSPATLSAPDISTVRSLLGPVN